MLSGRTNSVKRLLVAIRWQIKENLYYLLHEVNYFFISGLFSRFVRSSYPLSFVFLSPFLSFLLFFPFLHPSLISLLSLSSCFHFVWCLFSLFFTNLTSLLSYYVCPFFSRHYASLYNCLLILGNFNIHACCAYKTMVTEFCPVLDCFGFFQQINEASHVPGQILWPVYYMDLLLTILILINQSKFIYIAHFKDQSAFQ